LRIAEIDALAMTFAPIRDDESGRQKALTLKYQSHILEGSPDIVLRKWDVRQSVNVGESLTTVLGQDDCLGKPQATLEKASFVNNVLPCMELSVRMFIFSGQDEERHSGGLQHFLKTFLRSTPSDRHSVEFLVFNMEAVRYEVL
jgi:hypothetical protein